ncbi:hypothetical protein [Methanobacterium ferruginis]|uniref:hypothetical protein n=1 Tax=Methanobacterium ferruginis TaxID=710191 RepID=UPI00257302EF|nr:hypothetical protein [Methanobacterium ferruginis]BDZ68576.1 hypothetical protein GCM10025860_20240 [Methanobacterium ferruginis]
MMAAKQVEMAYVKKEKKDWERFIKKYETKRKGEVNQQGQNHPMVTYREKERIRYAQNMMEVKALHLPGELKEQVIYLIKNGPSVKQLCAHCKWQTVILALIFYIKFNDNGGVGNIERYRVAQDAGLTETVYLRITTKLGKYFQKHMALSKRIKPKN